MNPIRSKIIPYLESLRFPVLLLITAALFLVDLVVPDVVPFVDEVLLALIVALLSRLKRRKKDSPPEQVEP